MLKFRGLTILGIILLILVICLYAFGSLEFQIFIMGIIQSSIVIGLGEILKHIKGGEK